MSNELMTFENVEFGKLDLLYEDGNVLFPATECAKILGYANPQGAVRTHCQRVRDLLTPCGKSQQKKNFIPEGDLYRLIVRSRLPSAQRFEHWLFDEVLPSIRQTGGYRVRPICDLPHVWRGCPAILVEDAAHVLHVTREKVRDTMKGKPTIYVPGVDFESLSGDSLGEYKFFNRCQMSAKRLTVIFEPGFRKLQWELCGIGVPEDVMQLPAPVLSLPAAVQDKNDKLERCFAQIAQAMQMLDES
ncbi:MAG: BRO family protein [Butyricicoccus pullicaecorum]|uniref:BRO-N domain-containing protein n=1 Tax=Eisenbergiella massiliensis TaxID=1720294 RepID=UPI0023EFA7D6|nr:BRO family protein [Eisenbergiella massiliensis]MCI6705658.1 hypothetical protein [Eisenbergiella massiliensis]MDY2968554.1 BRO family protein [Butyricicoccus pullicaecorum]